MDMNETYTPIHGSSNDRTLMNYKLTVKCPDCGGEVYFTYLDMQYDALIYKCKECKKKYILK